MFQNWRLESTVPKNVPLLQQVIRCTFEGYDDNIDILQNIHIYSFINFQTLFLLFCGGRVADAKLNTVKWYNAKMTVILSYSTNFFHSNSLKTNLSTEYDVLFHKLSTNI
jgi:hypothetical protein